ncbi:uncharacterized protein CLUP02_02114 [Colletotrichum lupini]|uniref:Uncharacterized protein n=3 Tax=Colletotrichum acutatum species complex TaxID=2707335 RepID=A0A9Q8SEE4_9PEZI|nr:uncharacterized protein CLUP02_02114 [Colletotrichum lupini]XP_060380869.1 uncharacterized protein CTAM01_08336 [Colletotrichum tamarilloi]KAK1472456.1 hypothetical protein CCUS01_05840 [Colletotrichum cuscutae]KAK1496149.1 hypothetical protein CTAM01_08336 [Colletotrichum tamarilloi]UQC75460.1 hypothetical protein CLUP02_02114 [Colletotrichum lupini]
MSLFGGNSLDSDPDFRLQTSATLHASSTLGISLVRCLPSSRVCRLFSQAALDPRSASPTPAVPPYQQTCVSTTDRSSPPTSMITVLHIHSAFDHPLCALNNLHSTEYGQVF